MKIRLKWDIGGQLPTLVKGDILVVRKLTPNGYYCKLEGRDREYFIYLNEAEELNEDNQS